MSADVTSVLPQIALIEREIINPLTGLPLKAYDSAPFSLSSNDLPCFVNLAGPMTEDWDVRAGEDDLVKEGYENRVYLCTLYIVAGGAGIPGEAYALCEPYFALTRNTLQSHQSLKNLPGIQRVYFLGDDGARVRSYGGQEYYSIAFRLQIIGRVRVTYATGE